MYKNWSPFDSGHGSIPEMMSQTVLLHGSSLKIAMQSSLWRHFRNNPFPSLAWSWIKYAQVLVTCILQPYKNEISTRKRQNIVETGAEIHFSPKSILRLLVGTLQVPIVFFHSCSQERGT